MSDKDEVKWCLNSYESNSLVSFGDFASVWYSDGKEFLNVRIVSDVHFKVFAFFLGDLSGSFFNQSLSAKYFFHALIRS